MRRRRVTFVLRVIGTTDRPPQEWAEGVAEFLQAELNDADAPSDTPVDARVDVEDWETLR